MRYVFIDWSLSDSGLDQPLMNICMYGMAVCLSAACMRFVSALQSVICYIWLLLFCDIWFWQWMDFNAKERRKEKKRFGTEKTMCRLPKNGRRKNEQQNVYAISPGRYIFALCIRRYNRYTDGVQPSRDASKFRVMRVCCILQYDNSKQNAVLCLLFGTSHAYIWE